MTRWLSLVCLLTACALSAATLPPRADGELDIHHINTGLGDQTLFVLPDGTTLLVDTGDIQALFRERGQEPPFALEARPNASRPAGAWVARYIERVAPSTKLDYLFVTHIHPDHVYGIGDVVARVDADLVLDRGWPDYELPVPAPEATLAPYREMVDGLRIERIRPGRADQIVLRRDRDGYPTFEIRNVTANGEYWTGEGNETRSRFPPLSELDPEDYPTETRRKPRLG